MKIQHLMALVVLSLATVPGAQAAVLAGPITNAANAHTYYLLSSNTWTVSEAEAVGLGGHLVTINDAAENQWVLNTFFPLTGVPYASLWIGLNDAANEGQFVWASGEPVTFTYWYPGEPNNLGGADYASIRHPSEAPPTGSWNDLTDIPNPPTFGVFEVPTTLLPVAVTQPADQFMPGSAQLNGQAHPNGSPTLAWFEWGTSLAYGNVTPPQSVGSGSNAVGLSNVIVGLVSGTDYHFRARASNAFGSLAGLDQTFNLNTQRPVVTTLAADQLTTNSARLKGQVNPRGWPTAAWFEWGTDTNYGNLIGMQDVGQGSSVSNLSVVLNGLTTGTNYHYRLVATNAFGAGYGADQTFNLRVPTTNTWTGADPSGYWSAPANWSPPGVPLNGNDLVFPGGLPPGDMVSTNDLPGSFFRSITFSGASRHTIRGNPMTLTNRTDCILNSGTNVIACDLTFSGTPATPTWGAWSIRPSGFGELTVIGNVGGSSLYVAYMPLVIRGQFTGGSLFAEYGHLALYGDNPHPVSVQIHGSSGSTLRVEGSQPNLNVAMLWEMESASCPTLTGDGVVGDVTGCGYITPDSTLLVNNLLGPGASPASWRTLWIRLNGTNVGENGRLVAPRDVRLTGGFLQPFAGFNPQAGQVFTILQKTSPGLVANEFMGPEGSVTTLNGKPLRISYVGGDGNDVTLTVEATNTVNVQPTVSIISPTNGAILATPFGGTIQANAADSDGTVVRVDFFSDAALVGSVSNAPFHLAVTNIAAGPHALFAVATDDRGATKRSATVTVTVVTPVPIVLGAVQRFGTRFAFSYSANLGLRYAVERSATLSNWTPIWSNTANFNPMTFTDTTATNRMDLGLFAETFNSSNGGFTVTTPQPYGGPWNYNSGAGTWQEYGHGLPDNGHPNTSFLDSPPLTITAAGQAVLSFNHRWSREQDSRNWDGNQLRVSVNGGAFVAVPGTSFTSNGYNGTVNGTVGSALDGQQGWVGTSPGYTNGFLTSVAVLGNFNSGDVIRLRFMAASDSNTTGLFTNGWEIDSVQVNQGEPFTVGATGVNDFYRVRRLPNP